MQRKGKIRADQAVKLLGRDAGGKERDHPRPGKDRGQIGGIAAVTVPGAAAQPLSCANQRRAEDDKRR